MGTYLTIPRLQGELTSNEASNRQEMQKRTDDCKFITSAQLSDYYVEQIQNLFDGQKSRGLKPSMIIRNQKGGEIEQQILNSKPQTSGSKANIMEPSQNVQDSLKYPYSSIGMISYENSKQKRFGTGFLIGSNFVLTCAHNIYDRKRAQQSKNFRFYPAMNSFVGNQYECKKAFYPQQYKKDQAKLHLYDYGILLLEDPVGKDYGYFGLDFGGKVNCQVQLAGYNQQSYKNDDGNQVQLKKLKKAKGEIFQKKEKEGMIQYNISAKEGQSGSPIFMNQDNSYYVVGIHTNGGQHMLNEGVALNQEKRARINKWIGKINKKLMLNNLKIRDENLQVLIQKDEQMFQKINFLDLSKRIFISCCNQIGSEGVKYLANGNLVNLSTLNLNGNQIGSEGVKYLANGNLVNLSTLNLNGNQIGSEGVKYLANGNLVNLSTLNLNGNQIGSEGVKYLANGNLVNLSTLNLNGNQIGSEGVKYLANGNLVNLSTLNLNGNQIGSEGVKYLANGNLVNLSTLNLNGNQIGSEGVKYLANGNLVNLVNLQLQNNGISFDGVNYLSTYQSCFHLINLNLRKNQFSVEQKAKLLDLFKQRAITNIQFDG